MYENWSSFPLDASNALLAVLDKQTMFSVRFLTVSFCMIARLAHVVFV